MTLIDRAGYIVEHSLIRLLAAVAFVEAASGEHQRVNPATDPDIRLGLDPFTRRGWTGPGANDAGEETQRKDDCAEEESEDLLRLIGFHCSGIIIQAMQHCQRFVRVVLV
jgi:hypothetical protein